MVRVARCFLAAVVVAATMGVFPQTAQSALMGEEEVVTSTDSSSIGRQCHMLAACDMPVTNYSDDDTQCSPACAAPVVALPSPIVGLLGIVRASHDAGDDFARGRAEPPIPFPPRTFIII